jgi:hypothetical protein
MLSIYNNIDIIQLLASNLEFDDLLNFSIVNKSIYQIFDKLFYKNLAYKMYGNNFWLKARHRPIKKSHPLKNYKLELVRMEKFQKGLDSLNTNRWTKKDFYNYWKYNDIFI